MTKKDIAWKYATEEAPPYDEGKKGYKYLKCKFCSKLITGGVKRVKEHLACTHKNVAPCPKVTHEVKEEVKLFMAAFTKTKHMAQRNFEEMVDGGALCGLDESGEPNVRGPMDRFMVSPGEEIPPANRKEHREVVCDAIRRFLIENGIPFNVAKSPSFHAMLRAVGNYGRGLKIPTPYELSTKVLQRQVKDTEKTVEEIKATWPETGVSILSDGWSDMRNRCLINFLANNRHGTVFLKTVDASNVIKDAPKLFELLDGVVEEVGEKFVLQVVTDNASAYKAAGRMLMEKRKRLYWTPCAAHCIDLMLEKLFDLTQHKRALLKAKRVTNFIYHHQWVLSLSRKYAKKDILRPGATRFATAYLTLESIQELKQPLQMMFVSNEWTQCAWARKSEGKAVKDIILDERVFWEQVSYALKTTGPLVKVLRLVDGATPAMGFLYGAMDEAKEKIAENLNGEQSSYKEIWDIIDEKWERQMHRDLHACAYYLNPQFRWSPKFSRHPEVKRGLFSCMEKLLDQDEYLIVDEQLDTFINKRGLFGHTSSLKSYQTRAPVDWWDHCGDEVPELMSFAKKVLGLTCSASECERNWSTFNQVHTKERNRLKHIKLNNIVFIMYNNKLKSRHMKKQTRSTNEDPLIVGEEPASDDEWVSEPPLELDDNEVQGDESADDEFEEDDDFDDEFNDAEIRSKSTLNSVVRAKRQRTLNKGKSPTTRLLDEDDEEDHGHDDED